MFSSSTILRLEHLFEVDESDEYSKPVQVTLSKLFAPGFSFSDPVEMALTATATKEEYVLYCSISKICFDVCTPL